MASVRYIVLAACQSAGLYAQAGWESEAAAWIKKQGSRPCAYVGYRRGQGVAGFDNASVVFGGSDPRAALRRVRDSLERSLEFRSERQTEVDGFPALVMTARSKRRVYGVFGGGARPVPPVPPTDLPLYFEAVEANSTVAMMSTLPTAPNLEYSTDGETWQEWQHTTSDGAHTFDTLTLTAVGDRVYLRGVNSAGFLDVENQKISLFSMTGKIAAGGNAQSLVDGDTPTLVAKTMPLFSDFIITEQPSDVLTQAPALPATTLSENCYSSMFNGCTGLTQAPALPATTLAESCYADMFSGCTFDMSDDGTTFNFQCAATLPQTVGEATFSTPAELAAWMGNTNGFAQPEASLFAPYTKRESGPGEYCLTINPRRINPDWQDGDVNVVCAVPDDSVTYGLKFSNLPNSSPESLSPSYEIDDAFIAGYFDGTNLPTVYPQECADMIAWLEANKGKFYCEKKADDPNGLAGVTISIVEQDNPSNVLDTSEPMSDETTSCL